MVTNKYNTIYIHMCSGLAGDKADKLGSGRGSYCGGCIFHLLVGLQPNFNDLIIVKNRGVGPTAHMSHSMCNRA